MDNDDFKCPNCEGEEILEQKFLSIGRSKGFASKSNLSENLLMKENFFNKNFQLLKKNKQLIFIGLFIILMIVFSIIFI